MPGRRRGRTALRYPTRSFTADAANLPGVQRALSEVDETKTRLARAMAENGELLPAVRGLARALGWHEYHPLRSEGSPAGWPDLVLAHPDQARLLFRELKTEKGRLSPAQGEWLAVLAACGADVGVWRPSDWLTGRVRAELEGPDASRASA